MINFWCSFIILQIRIRY